MPEKFLIIGPTSYYGSNFIKLLAEKGAEVSTFSLRRWSQEFVGEPDYVVNFAAANIVAESWERPTEYLLVNVVAHTELLEQLRKKKIKKYVNVSTPEVYGSVNAWVTEDQVMNPSTPYGVSKAATDMMLFAYHRAYDFPAVITRTANIYGPGQPLYRLITKALDYKKRGETFKLDGKGASVRCFIHVRDACEATYLAATKGRPGEIYHISSYDALTIKELVERIGCKWESVPERLGKDFCYMMDSTKLRKMGWQDKISLEEGLAQCELLISA